jgi:glycosyltransferase involved in cell wall biosynthesis
MSARDDFHSATRTAVGVVVKNEERDIAEWLAFHLLLGFDGILVFDNNSGDRTADIVRAASCFGRVQYHLWTRADARSQMDAYLAACSLYREAFDWIAFIDSDEFLILADGQDLKAFLSRFSGAAAVGINWAIFGSSGHIQYPPGLIIESFTWRSSDSFFPNRHVKSIVRPSLVQGCDNPHAFEVNGPYLQPDGGPLEWFRTSDGNAVTGLSQQTPSRDIAQVNHYFTRSYAHWIEKMRRGYPNGIPRRGFEDFLEHDRNEIQDVSATRNSAAVRKLAAKIRAEVGL